MSEAPSSLQQLVGSIAKAVLEAQEMVQHAQINSLMSFFTETSGRDGLSPITMDINLPSARPNAEPGATDTYRVPYLSVLPYSALRIKEAEINFDVAFNNLAEPSRRPLLLGGGEGAALPLKDVEPPPDISIDMKALKKGGSLMAHVKLCLEGGEVPEGTARLINELIKTAQNYGPAPESENPGES